MPLCVAHFRANLPEPEETCGESGDQSEFTEYGPEEHINTFACDAPFIPEAVQGVAAKLETDSNLIADPRIVAFVDNAFNRCREIDQEATGKNTSKDTSRRDLHQQRVPLSWILSMSPA